MILRVEGNYAGQTIFVFTHFQVTSYRAITKTASLDLPRPQKL